MAGIKIFAFINIFILGLVPLLSGVLTIPLSRDPKFIKLLNERLGTTNVEPSFLVWVALFYIVIGGLFLLGGWGILRRKRKLLYLSLSLCVFWVFLGVLGLVRAGFDLFAFLLFIVYPGIFIFYFTQRKIFSMFI